MVNSITLPLSQYRRRLNSIFNKFESGLLDEVHVTVNGEEKFVTLSVSRYEELYQKTKTI